MENKAAPHSVKTPEPLELVCLFFQERFPALSALCLIHTKSPSPAQSLTLLHLRVVV